MEAKLWWQSKILWVNALAVALVALESQFALLQPFVPGNVYAYIAVSLGVANKVLRVFTTGPLAFKPQDNPANNA